MNASTQPARLRPFRPQPFGRYTLLSHLATGGMGEIYLARLEGAQGFEKLCVIKKILPQLAADTEFVERFVGEARTLVRLSHGSIAQVLDMGLHEGDAYMALEHVDGKDLRKVAARVRDRQVPLPLTFILYIMGRVLDALAYAHRKKDDDGEDLKLVHRDISPQNILISYEGEVKVIDFGLAKSRLSAAKTNPSIILGKFLYMSPEQARHQPVDRRSDLYAVGLCLYELISGKNPFDSIHPGELMSVVANPRIPPLDEVEPLTPRAVTALVARALAVDPSQRFQTAEEFRGRLQACLMEIDPSAGPESVSRFMRELFAADFQSERRLLASLKEVPRMAAAEASPEEGGPAPRPTMPAMLPPKTIRLDGPVEALSFHPTPRSREGGGPVSDGETRPGVMVDESTRPAIPIEALEEEARARAARQPPQGTESASSVEVRPEAYDRPAEPALRPAIPEPALRPASLTREVPMAALPPEALPPAPEPRPTPPDLRPTELALPAVQPRTAPPAPEMPWDDGPESPAASSAESTDPRAAPLPSAPPPPPSASQPLRAAAIPPPPPSASQPLRAAAIPPPPPSASQPLRAAAIPPPSAPPPPSASQALRAAAIPPPSAPPPPSASQPLRAAAIPPSPAGSPSSSQALRAAAIPPSPAGSPSSSQALRAAAIPPSPAGSPSSSQALRAAAIPPSPAATPATSQPLRPAGIPHSPDVSPAVTQPIRADAIPLPPATPPRPAVPPVASAFPAVGAPQAAQPPRPQPPPAPASGSGPRVGAPVAPVPPPAVAPPGGPARPAMGAAPVPPSAPTSTAQLASGTAPRTGAVMMPAVVPPPSGATPPRTASLMAMPMVAPPPPPGSTPARGAPSVPSAEQDVVPGVAESGNDAGWESSAPGEGRLEEPELPVVTPEEMGHAEESPRPGDADTHPRFSRPSRSERTEDTQPRALRDGDTDPRIVRDGDTDPRVVHRHDDTQPRVVLDEALLRDVEGTTGEPEEKSSPGRPRGASRRARSSSAGLPAQQGAPRRTGSVPALRAAPPARADDDEDDDVRVSLTPHEETRRTPIPTRPGAEAPTRRAGDNTRRTAMPAQSRRLGPVWMVIGLVLVLLAAVLMLALSPGLRVSMGLEEVSEGPLPDRPLGSPARKPSLGGSGATGGPASSTVARADTAEAAPPEAAEAASAGRAQVVPAVAADEGGGARLAAAPAAAAPAGLKAPAPEPAPAAESDADAEDEDLLAPLESQSPASQKAAATAKRPSPPKKVRTAPRMAAETGKGLTQLQREWRDTSALYQRLKAKHSCLPLGLICTRYPGLKGEVEAAGDVNDEDTLRRVREMRADLDFKKLELE
ncbi:serine/threonine-protein kinase [Myxococcus sp. RHSTA-1-4]|uniref:serine/threonine-protein kinase n=1 Tax=Myxococcus sp. RHSTA-1-4 TaxID=2874601 RepID=UPI001CBFF13C|nr:serine/threonine-protein kinase [Myxococcus sp. RHSTA-1-4]MBZ4416171.1 protein kinase [Myxococcus sp. RHSTA-1-4]